MILFKKILIFWLCISYFIFQVFCSVIPAEAGVTAQNPQVFSSPEEDIPLEDQTSKIGGKKWLWALLGAALIGGVAVVAGGAGGGDNGGDDGGSTASYNFSW